MLTTIVQRQFKYEALHQIFNATYIENAIDTCYFIHVRMEIMNMDGGQ